MSDIHNVHWKRLERKTVIDTPFLKVYNDKVELPSGHIIDEYSVVGLPSGVIIVATNEAGQLLTQFEYKYAIDKTILNLPSGSVEDGLSVLEVAAKELLEETGYVSNDMELIQTLYEYASKTDHVIHVVRAKNAFKQTDAEHEITEMISSTRLINVNDPDYGGVFETTYIISALALTLPEFLLRQLTQK